MIRLPLLIKSDASRLLRPLNTGAMPGASADEVRMKDTHPNYVVPNVEYLECPDCSEQLFDHTAMQKIEAHSPAYAKHRAAEKRTAAGR